MYGSATPKRHIAWCNSEWIQCLDLGALRGWRKEMNPNKTARVYLDKRGVKRYVGSKFLKATQHLECTIYAHLMSIVRECQ